MSEFAAPDWVKDAFARADDLAARANARWAESLGDPGLFGGFQVTPVSGGSKDLDGNPSVLFKSVLFGGRNMVGTAHQVEVAQRAFILSRMRRGHMTTRTDSSAARGETTETKK